VSIIRGCCSTIPEIAKLNCKCYVTSP
jgi:hypothetical protein